LIKPVLAEKPRSSSLSSTEDQEVLEMIDTSSDKKPQPASKPQPMSLRRKVLSQIQEEEEEDDERLKLNSDEEDVDPREDGFFHEHVFHEIRCDNAPAASVVDIVAHAAIEHTEVDHEVGVVAVCAHRNG
jgi:hypothetical protein